MRLKVLAHDELPAGWERRHWLHSCVGTAPQRFAGLGLERRWQVRYATAWQADELIGLLPMCRPEVAVMWDRDYDAGRLLMRPVPEDARRWLFLGGCRDLAAGSLVRAAVASAGADAVRSALVSAAVAAGRAEGLHVMAAYLRDAERDAFLAGSPGHAVAVRCGETAILRLPITGTPDPGLVSYLALLDGRRRNKIRREWRDFARAGLRTGELDVPDAIRLAADLVAAVKRRHGVADHPRIAAMRLRRWYDLNLGQYRAFTVHDSAKQQLLAACFVCAAGRDLDVHEIGLADGHRGRLSAYLESVFYAPIRYALANGCTRVDLGGKATTTKRLRGARIDPVWAVAFDD